MRPKRPRTMIEMIAAITMTVTMMKMTMVRADHHMDWMLSDLPLLNASSKRALLIMIVTWGW